MKLQFKSQMYQADATRAVVEVFEGQSRGTREDIVDRKIIKTVLLNKEFIEEEIISRFSNTPLKNVPLLENIQKVQKQDELLKISTKIEEKKLLNLTVEMETGTGKTYVYTKTMFELNRKYGWSKFIIIVPSIAIREGVNKSLSLTQEHFKIEYKKKLRYFIYDTKNSSNLTNIANFSSSSEIEVIIMNYQAFATRSKETRKIYEKQDSMQSRRPIDMLKATRPILIIDEPQRLGKTAEAKLKEFDPLFTLRYSATHKENFHKVYRLDAIDAYNEKLVKRISVKAIDVRGDSATGGYVFLDSIKLSKNANPTALLEIDMKLSSSVQKKSIRVSEGDNLYDLSNKLSAYEEGFTVVSIDGYENSIRFLNGKKVMTGEVTGSVQEKHLRRIQIRETIRSHVEKEKELFGKGIKVLSLFFIDEVKKYRDYEAQDLKGEYALMFEEEYRRILNDELGLFDEEYRAYVEALEVDEIHKGYFSIDKKGKAVDPKADKSGNSNDVSAYDLIMKDKERLLSFDEATRFIFSHSALKEGWDNPNVFQICTLKQSSSTDSKRQEIGRGLRICVNKHGIRQDQELLGRDFFEINALTVVASDSYDEFASSLQKEILASLSRETKITVKVLGQITLKNDDEMEVKIGEKLASILIEDWKEKNYLGADGFITQEAIKAIKNKTFEVIPQLEAWKKEIEQLMVQANTTAVLSDMIGNGKNEKIGELTPNANFDKKEFQELWSKINAKATYSINVESESLQKASVEAINQFLEIAKVSVKITTATQKDLFELEDLSAGKEMMGSSKNSYEKMSHELGDTTYDLVGEIERNTALTRKTIVTILSKISEEKFKLFCVNPEEFILKTATIINQQKAKLLVSGIEYFKTDEVYQTDIFTIPNFKYNLTKDTMSVERHIYDYLKYDSEVEKTFAKELEKGQITVYAKLPNGFKIPTPMGDYNPDWAVVFNGMDKKNIYFVAETKGDCDPLQLKGSEEAKIEYAKKYFECLNDDEIAYDCVASYGELVDKVLR
jgi:type III restriction enzyme